MQYQYITCYVIPRSSNTNILTTLLHRAEHNDFNFGIHGDWEIREDGYHLIPFTFRIPMTIGLSDFLPKVEDILQITKIEPTSENDFRETVMSLIEIGAIVHLELTLEEWGQVNDSILNNSPMWAMNYWKPHSINEDMLERAFDILDKWNVSMSYKPLSELPKPDRELYPIILFFQISNVSQVKDFKNELFPNLHLDHLYWLYKPTERIPFLRSLESMEFDKSLPVTRETASSFRIVANTLWRNSL